MSDDGWNDGPSQSYQSNYHSNQQSYSSGGFQVGFGSGSGDGFRGDRRGGWGGNRGRGGWGNRGCDDERDNGGSRGNWRGNGSESGRRGWGNAGQDEQRGSSRGGWKDNNSEPLIMTVDSSLVGRIIGRAGSKIKELQDQSGARIKVSNDDETGDGKVVITGSSDNQAKAKALIDGIVNESMNGNSELDFLYRSRSNEEKDDAPIDWAALNANYEKAQKEKWAKCPPLIKNFYREHEDVKLMSQKEVQQFRKQSNNIMVSHVFGETDLPIPNPVKTFEQAFGDYPEILEEIRKQGFSTPSPIQCQMWPILLQGGDLIGISQTGSGKTLAFLLPALIHIEGQPVPRSERGGANILILAPTRELALQIDKEVKKYSYRGIKCICVYGGGSRKEQAQVLDTGVEIIIATPGRLNDFVQAGKIDVGSVTYLVLDEADRMLDMGFEPQIRKVLLDIRPDRQTVMTSATWPEGVRRLAQSYMKDPIQVFIGTLDLAACHSVTQIIEIIPKEDKMYYLKEFFSSMQPEDKVIVFVGKKTVVDDIASDLAIDGIHAQSIHGNREQCDREQALEDIKSGDVRILLATDVASRGIDIGDITHIVNYDFPRNIEEYVHRVGRTGRAGRTGTAISFFTREDWGSAKELIDILEEAGQEVPEELRDMMERFSAMKERRAREREEGGGGGGGFGGGRGGGGRGGGRGGGGRFGGGSRQSRWD